MSRLRNPRTPPRAISPGTPEADAIGLSDRTDDEKSPIPGGKVHLVNEPTERQDVPIAAPRPEHRGILAHGVPPDEHTTRERAEDMRGGPNDVKPVRPHYRPSPDEVPAVPVYLVQRGSGGRPLRSMATARYTVPANTADAIRLASRDVSRSEIKILVETAAGAAGAAPTGIRISPDETDLDVGRGALLPAGTGKYQGFDYADELFAISNDGSACTVSVIYLYDVGGAG